MTEEDMKGNLDHCDTELCLSPCGLQKPSHSSTSGDRSASSGSPSRCDQERANAKVPDKKQQQITLLYEGHIRSALDVTEIQARAIIFMAQHCEIEAKKHSHGDQSSCAGGGTAAGHGKSTQPSRAAPADVIMRRSLSMPTTSATAGGGCISMKRSLQRFLEKRKTRRALDSFPRRHDRHHLPLELQLQRSSPFIRNLDRMNVD